MSERSGIEIDYCPTCRGVWLDRGELDKILDRAAGPASMSSPVAAVPASRVVDSDDRRFGRETHPSSGYRPRKKRESWLSELFD
ncbi:MAG: hypothetical protein JWO46_3503 [Nocardioidaceae bacterium]|nr:hypothetical protein [Nocardioidaceae bacterium]